MWGGDDMGDNRLWKAVERRIARELAGERIPVSGRARGDAPDVATPTLSVEVKARACLPTWLLGAMRQAEAAARPGQTPAVILHQIGDPYDDALVILRLRDFKALFGAVSGSM